MDTQNLAIDRLIFHEVHKRRDDRNPVPATYGDQVLALTADAMTVFQSRIADATGNQSKSMDMDITGFGAESAVQIASDLMAVADDAEFIETSKRVADKLTDAQTSRGHPGGLLAIFSGTAGVPAKPIIGFIKAELHGGFRRTDNLGIEYLKTLFMTPQTKLYKIALFMYNANNRAEPLPTAWLAKVYDNQMSASNHDGAAVYFYEGFLGLGLPQTSARLTRTFWEGTQKFIKGSDLPEETKTDLLNGLYTYLRVDQSPTVEIAAFANTYLDQELRDGYRTHMLANDFPDNAVPKDVSEFKGKFKRRRVRFAQDVQLTASAEAFNELVTIESIAGDADQQWTQITIRDRIRDQE